MTQAEDRLHRRNMKHFSEAVEECQAEREWELTADALYHLVLEYRAKYADDKEAKKKFMTLNSDLCDPEVLRFAWQAALYWSDPMEAVTRLKKWMEKNL